MAPCIAGTLKLSDLIASSQWCARMHAKAMLRECTVHRLHVEALEPDLHRANGAAGCMQRQRCVNSPYVTCALTLLDLICVEPVPELVAIVHERWILMADAVRRKLHPTLP